MRQEFQRTCDYVTRSININSFFLTTGPWIKKQKKKRISKSKNKIRVETNSNLGFSSGWEQNKNNRTLIVKKRGLILERNSITRPRMDQMRNNNDEHDEFWVLKNTCLQNGLDLVVEHKDKGTACASKYVGKGSLEEGTASFALVDGGPAVHCVLVYNFCLLTSWLHHHTSTDCVEWVRYDARNGGHSLQQNSWPMYLTSEDVQLVQVMPGIHFINPIIFMIMIIITSIGVIFHQWNSLVCKIAQALEIDSQILEMHLHKTQTFHKYNSRKIVLQNSNKSGLGQWADISRQP